MVLVAESKDTICPSGLDIWSAALPDLGWGDRALLRTVALAACTRITSISGAEHIAVDRDPFILALNHNTRLESLCVPALLMLFRGGRRIHFLADWNFRMVPGLDLLYRRAGAITVPNKRAKPRFLNLLQPMFTDRVPPLQQARDLLLAGASIGIFPEGKVNRDPMRLLRGRLGTARLSIETGVPVVPAGLRFAPATPGSLPRTESRFSIVIGAPLVPPPASCGVAGENIHAWHAEIMSGIGELSAKSPSHSSRGKEDEKVRAD